MKLSWKIVLVVLLIVTLTVSVSSYVMIAAAFQAELDSQASAAADESQLLCLTLGALASQTAGSMEGALLEQLESNGLTQRYRMMVYRQDGGVLWQNREEPANLTPADVGQEGLCYGFFQKAPGDSRYLETIQRLELNGESFYVDLLQEANRAFTQRDANLRVYRQVMLLSIAACTLASIACATVLTGPIRKLSRSTRSMASGQYSYRVKVRSRDELGALAEDFNHMADALERKIQELAAAAQRQKDFTASFAHELKTPLTSVIGYADTLRSRELPRQQQLEAANYIFTEGKRLEAMSFALLDLFALERSQPQLVPIQAQALARSVAASANYLMDQSRLEFRLSVEPGSFHGEPNLLKTLRYNLLDNARKASEAGGSVELLGRTTPRGYLFQVVDHGRGIPPEALERITEPFYMVDKSRARAQGGAGLGLALCQQIAAAHGACLRCDSQEGEGTTVSLILGGGES